MCSAVRVVQSHAAWNGVFQHQGEGPTSDPIKGELGLSGIETAPSGLGKRVERGEEDGRRSETSVRANSSGIGRGLERKVNVAADSFQKLLPPREEMA